MKGFTRVYQKLVIVFKDNDQSTKKATSVEDEKRLSEELRTAQAEIDRLMGIVREKSEQDSASQNQMESVHDALEKMRTELESSQRLAKEQTENLRNDLEARESKLRQVQSNLLLAEKELEKKFQATGAYLTMKKIMLQKNSQIKTLRGKLIKLGALEDELGSGGNGQDED